MAFFCVSFARLYPVNKKYNNTMNSGIATYINIQSYIDYLSGRGGENFKKET